MNFFEGLSFYQLVLLGLGVLFFLVLLVAFITLLARGKDYNNLLKFFIIPLLMIGFPGIKSFQYQGIVANLGNTTAALQNDPTNASLREQLQAQVKQAADQPNQSPQTMVKIAAGQFALGEEAAAKAVLEKIAPAAPPSPEASDLRTRIELNDSLKSLAAQVQQRPQDAEAKADLKKSLAGTSNLHIANPAFLANIARAQAVAGNSVEALSLANTALKINPNLAAVSRSRTR